MSTDQREWSPQPGSDFAAEHVFTDIGILLQGGKQQSLSIWELSWPASPKKKKKDKCEIVILPYQELNTVSYAVYIPLFSPINKTLFMQSTDSCLYIKRISLLSTRKLSFHFSKLLDEHLSLEVTPRIWTQPLLPVKPWQKGYASKWILSFLSLPKASNSSFSYIQAAWCPVKTIH